MVILLFLNRNEERGEELKVPHHARATSARNGNMPGVTAACLIPNITFLRAFGQFYFLVVKRCISVNKP